MPIHNLGYRPWDGKRTSSQSRWWTIAENGIRIAAKSRWVKRMVMFAWLPVMYWGMGFFFVGQSLDASVKAPVPDDVVVGWHQEMKDQVEENMPAFQRKMVARRLRSQFRSIPGVNDLAGSIEVNDRTEARNRIWNWLFMSFFRYPQGILILVLLGAVTPGLISHDIRSRAFLLYFSRPIGRFEYIAGKLFIPATFIMFVTTLPAFFLYFFGIMMSPDTSVIWSTWDIPFRIVAATICLVLPTASLALMLSSVTQESRFASFAWFAVWTLGHGAWIAIVASQAIKMQLAPFDPAVIESDPVRQWGLLSLYNNLGAVQSWIFGFSTWAQAMPGAIVLTGLTAVSLFILYRRVSAPIRV